MLFAPIQKTFTQKSDCWNNFRGNIELQGVSQAKLPAKLSLLWSFKTSDAIKALFMKCGVDNVTVRTDEDYVKALIALFKKRI